MTDPSTDNAKRTETPERPPTEEEGYQEGKRAGAHPVVVVVGVILGLWFLLWIYAPGSRHQPASTPPPRPSDSLGETSAAAVMFRVEATLPELNVVTLVVLPQATDSQVGFDSAVSMSWARSRKN